MQTVYIASVNYYMEDLNIIGIYNNKDRAVIEIKKHDDYENMKEADPKQWSDKCVFYATNGGYFFSVEMWPVQ